VAQDLPPLRMAERMARIAALVDPSYYRRRVQAFTDLDATPEDLVLHYLSRGAALGLSPNPLFDDAYYRTQVAGSLPAGTTPLEHYLECGAAAGLDPSPLFATRFYLDANADVAVAGVNPLEHFLAWGVREHWRRTLPDDLPDLEERIAGVLRGDPDNLLALRLLGELRFRQKRHSDAGAALEKVAGQPGQDATVRTLLLARSQLHWERRELRRCIEACHELLALDPSDWFSRLRLGQVLLMLGQWRGARSEMAQAAADGGAESLAARQHSQFLQEAAAADELKPQDHAARPMTRACEAGAGLLLLDTSFPSPQSSFRYGEFSSYLKAIPGSRIYSSTWEIASLGGGQFADLARRYSSASGVALDRVQTFDSECDLSCRTAYCVFLNNAHLFFREVDGLRAERLAFTLYPGGGFVLNDTVSDTKLRRLCDDSRLGCIVTTQALTWRYLVEGGFCAPERILHVFGGIIPDRYDPAVMDAALGMRRDNGDRLQVCFVAHRYSATGIEKGYDVFAALVRAMRAHPKIDFHVVGGFAPDTIDLAGAANIAFHGIQGADFFPAFYSRMDIIVSPNISESRLNGGRGSFDGFPTTVCVEAGLRGVAMFLADLDSMNTDIDGRQVFVPGRDVEIIDRDPVRLLALVERYAEDRSALRRLAMQGREVLLREFSFERQMTPRVDMLQSMSK
jgi:glycosyltransferase involved in cell wall biosynthesis